MVGVGEMDRETLLSEGVAAKFIRYARVDTTSSEQSESTPSTEQQWELARMLEGELKAIGLVDVAVTEHAFVIGRLPSNVDRPAPAVGFVAHMDTVPGIPGSGVKPVVHSNYSGGPIEVGHGVVLDPYSSPVLSMAVGCDIITSDGSTLLGADDKAGIAGIMQALVTMVQDSSLPRPDVWVAFTPDEEIGSGVEKFPYSAFGANVAYTLDGGELGELSEETFNAANGVVTIHGVSAHPGTARGKMINALHIASEVLSSIPSGWRPETTHLREGFIHPVELGGNVEQARIKLIIRDFDSDLLAMRERAFTAALSALEARYPGSRIEWHNSGGYRNIKAGLDQDPRVVELALQAMKMAGVKPIVKPIRGGTDGARMTFEGVLTPNLFTGGGDVHSRGEWVCVQWMEKAAHTVTNLAGLWAQQ